VVDKLANQTTSLLKTQNEIKEGKGKEEEEKKSWLHLFH